VVSSFFVHQVYYYGHCTLFESDHIRHFLHGPLLAFVSINTVVTRSHGTLGKGIASQLIKPSMHTPLVQLFKEDILEVSKYADLLIVSGNLYEIDPDTDVKNHGCIHWWSALNVQRLCERIKNTHI